MKNINYLKIWLVGILVWFFALYHAERLNGPLEISPFLYAFAALVGVSIVCIRPLARMSAISLSGMLLAFWFALKIGLGNSLFGSDLPLAVTEVCAIAVTSFIACQIVKHLNRIEQLTADAAIIDLDKQVSAFEIIQTQFYREIRRARQFERPLALVTLTASDESVRQALKTVVDEYQRKSVERFLYGCIAELLLNETSQCDIISRRGHQFVIMLPEASRESAAAAIKRLKKSAKEKFKLRLQAGLACFPDQEVTFSGLLERAEAEMLGQDLQLTAGS